MKALSTLTLQRGHLATHSNPLCCTPAFGYGLQRGHRSTFNTFAVSYSHTPASMPSRTQDMHQVVTMVSTYTQPPRHLFRFLLSSPVAGSRSWLCLRPPLPKYPNFFKPVGQNITSEDSKHRLNGRHRHAPIRCTHHSSPREIACLSRRNILATTVYPRPPQAFQLRLQRLSRLPHSLR